MLEFTAHSRPFKSYRSKLFVKALACKEFNLEEQIKK